MATTVNETETTAAPAPKKRNPVFIIILAVLILGGAWFGISKYQHSLHHEDTDDAQVSSDISPVIPRVAGYVLEVRVKDNQQVKRGDTLLVLDNRDYQVKVEQAEAALQIAKSSLGSAQATSSAAFSNIATSRASIGTIDAQIAQANVSLTRATQDYNRYS
ncbi:MAG: biotin/lipoyl-binding protein, partial [Chitinophagaceae bacterium]